MTSQEVWIMSHPASRRSARPPVPRGKDEGAAVPSTDPGAHNEAAPDAPIRSEPTPDDLDAEGLEYQRDLGSEQDA
jgi:hypothetical protein